MNAKENALRIIHFDNPEHVVSGCPGHHVAYRGCHHRGYTDGGDNLPLGSSWIDIWGTGWHYVQEGVMAFPVENPLADLVSTLPNYTWPDPDDERICGQVYEQAKGWDSDEQFLICSHRDTLWEKSYMLVGMEDIMCYFHTEPGAVRELLHHIMDFQLGIAKHYLDVGVEVASMSDDLGTQSGLLISPETIHKFFVPEYQRLFDLYKQHGVLINFHSCGHIIPILDMFMDLGVDILNPVQATANDLNELRRVTQGRMALQGAVRSSTIMTGPVGEIRREVAQRLWQLGRDGGYFCSPDQGLPWPQEHIQAMNAAVQELGRYPLQPPMNNE